MEHIFVLMTLSIQHRLGTFVLTLGFWAMIAGLSAQTTWRRTYGGLDTDEVRSIQQLDDGGFLALGSTGSFGIGGDMYVLRLNSAGLVIWSAYYGNSSAQIGIACHQVDGGFMIAGTTSNGANGGYDMQLSFIDDDGALIWLKDIGSAEWELCMDMKSIDDGFILVGTTYGFGSVSGDAVVIRTDSQGDTLWTQRFGGSGLDEAMGVSMDSMGNIIVCGALDVDTESQDAFIAKLSPSGNLLWFERFGGDSTDYISDVTEATEGGYVGVGGTNSYSTVVQVLVHKVNDDGTFGWQREYGSGGDTKMRRVIRTNSGEYAMLGYNSAFNAGRRDMFLILVNWEGYFILGKNYGGPDDEEGYSLWQNDDGGYILGGFSDTYGPGIRAGFVIRCGPDAETSIDIVFPYFDPLSMEELGPTATPLVLFPNPSTGWIEIGFDVPLDEVRLLDALGRVVEEHRLNAGVSRISSMLPSGAYIVEATAQNGEMRRGRILIERP